MSHFGVLSYKGKGHLNPLIALSRQLAARGHRVTFFQKPQWEFIARQDGLEFFPIGTTASLTSGKEWPDGSKSGSTDFRYRIGHIVGDMEIFLHQIPAAAQKVGIDALIVDEIVLAGPTVAQLLDLPYFVVSTSVPHNFGWFASLKFLGYKHPTSILAGSQNAALDLSVFRVRGPVRRKLDEFRWKRRLGPVQEIDKVFPPLAHLTQLPQCLDFPRRYLPGNFHYTGPFVDEAARSPVEFPWNRLDDRPLVYASLGTARNIQRSVFNLIAEACSQLDLQLVISLGGRDNPENFAGLPGGPIVVTEAPQLEILKRAKLIFTHGGLNTVLEALLEGKPMIVIPVAYDQPAVAARLARLKVAEVLRPEGLSTEDIRVALNKLSSSASYTDAAKKLQSRIRATCGLEHACNVIEDSLRNPPITPTPAGVSQATVE